MSRIVVIGMDSAAFELIRRWAERGDLPNLALKQVGPPRELPRLRSDCALWATWAEKGCGWVTFVDSMTASSRGQG